jgi:hypothetical protein
MQPLGIHLLVIAGVSIVDADITDMRGGVEPL